MEAKFMLQTTPGFWITLAAMVLLLPLPWLFAVLLSSAVHELFHLGAARVTGVRICGLRLGIDGAYLETPAMSALQSMVCAAAGPLGALLLLLLARWMPRTAICALVQSCYHLLPVCPLDGGRALAGFAELIRIPNGGWVCNAVEAVVLCLLGFAGVYLTFVFRLGMLPVLLAVGMIFRACREKFLANRTITGYNRGTYS